MRNNALKIIAIAASLVFASRSAVIAAFEFKGRGGRSAALGGAYTAVSDDVESIWWNPAGLRLVRTLQVDTSYSALYGLSDLALMNFGMVIPTMNLGTWGVGYSSFGFPDYRETDLRLSFATGLRDGVYFGTNLKRNSIDIGGDGGSGGVFAMDVGFLGMITDDYSVGFNAYNLNRPRLLSGPSEFLEQRYMAGFYATPIEGVAVSLDLHKVPDREWEHRVGVELPVMQGFSLRAGVQTRPARLSFGFGVEAGIFTLNYAFRNHQALDHQHMFAMQARFGADPSSRVRASAVERETQAPDILVNINTATLEELSAVPGLGPSVAGRVIEYRSQTGNFRSVRDIMRVYGLTRAMYNRFRDYLTVSGETSIARPAARREYQPPAPSRPAAVPVPRAETRELEVEKPESVKVDPEPVKSEPDPQAPAEPEPSAPEPEVIEAPPAPAEPVKVAEEKAGEKSVPDELNLNTADLGALRAAGMPTMLARNLIRYRSQRGDFSSWDDVMRVPGMQRAVLDRLRETMVLGPSD